MRWLIVEDALRNAQGHWFEYVGTFDRGLRALGDEVTILADRKAEPFIRESLRVRPVLPDSIWHRMGDGAGTLRRHLRVPLHAWRTWRAVRRFLREDDRWDVIFVPTVLVHHLLGWYGLIRWSLRASRARVLLFFPNLPVRQAVDGTVSWNPAPTTRLMRGLLNRLRPDILSGRVLLGVETGEMREAMAKLTGLPVVYLPHPVNPPAEPPPDSADAREPLLMACYGPARTEKGSDILQEALERHLRRHPGGGSRFAYQWMRDIANDRGGTVGLNGELKANPRVEVIERFFAEGEYARRLRETRVMLLPYRRSSYGLRVSRVVIEALVNGIPVVATRGTTLMAQAEAHGAAVGCEDGSVESLCGALEAVEARYADLHASARSRRAGAVAHFSVRNFRELLRACLARE